MRKILYTLLLLAGTCFYHLQAATDGYTLSFRDDPSTTISVGWSGDNGTVYYGTTDQGTNYQSYSSNKASDRSISHKGQDRHFARLSNLSPKTVYYFVIVDQNNVVSSRFKFQTLSDDPNDPVTFISGGDTRQAVTVLGVPVENCPTSVGCRGERQEGNQLVAKLRPDFIAFNGDFVRNSLGIGVQDEWQDWLDDWQMSIASDGRMTPLVMTQGNHEDNTDMYNLFDIPQEEYYVLDIHNGLMRLYSLNSELNACSNTQQLNWLTNDLQNNTGTSNDPAWKVVQYHIPTFAMGNGYGLVQDQMDCWVPEFQTYGVKLVLESHTHITKWTYPVIRNSGGTDFVQDANGIVYMGEGQWGAPYRVLDFTGSNQKAYVRDQDVFDNFFWVQVNQSRISIQTVKFENVASVAALTDDDLGTLLPTSVPIWTPTNGSEVIIQNPMTSTEPKAEMKVKRIFPVPSKQYVTIEFGEVMNGATLEVYNGLGKFCRTEEINGQANYQLDMSDLCSGVNFIYIKTKDGNVESHKVVKVE